MREVTGETFRTVLINRRKRPVPIYESDSARPIDQLASIGRAGAEKVLESCDPGTIWAPYDEVIWNADGSVTLKENRGFIPVDYGKYPLTILNVDGAELESRVIASRAVFCPKGIPVTVRLELTDQEVVYKELRIVMTRRMVPGTRIPGLFEFQDELKDEWVSRSEKELGKIQAELEKS